MTDNYITKKKDDKNICCDDKEKYDVTLKTYHITMKFSFRKH